MRSIQICGIASVVDVDAKRATGVMGLSIARAQIGARLTFDST